MTNENFLTLLTDHLLKLAPLLVAPFAALVLVTTLLVFKAPTFVPRWALIAVLALGLVNGSSTILIRVPIQLFRTCRDTTSRRLTA